MDNERDPNVSTDDVDTVSTNQEEITGRSEDDEAFDDADDIDDDADEADETPVETE